MFKLDTVLEATDLYQEPLPSFNLRGRKTIPSLAGGITSLAVYLVVLVYSYLRLGRLIRRTNPEISQFREYGVRTSDEEVNFD